MGSDPLGVPNADVDDGSSSLSELGERAGHDDADNVSGDDSDANDTEAETERLEDSPQKLRSHHNVVLTSAHDVYVDRNIPGKIVDNGQFSTLLNLFESTDTLKVHHSDDGRFGQTSDISSLADSGEEIGKALSTTPSSPRKRKRSSFEEDSLSDHEPSTRLFSDTTTTLVENAFPDVSAEEDNQEANMDLHGSDNLSRKAQQYAPTRDNYQKGKRKVKKIRDDQNEETGDTFTGTVLRTEQREGHEAGYSNGEDMEVDEAGDVPEADNLVKTEEGGLSLLVSSRQWVDGVADRSTKQPSRRRRP